MLSRSVKTKEIYTRPWNDDWEDMREVEKREDLLVTVFHNGKVVREWTFAEVRANSEE